MKTKLLLLCILLYSVVNAQTISLDQDLTETNYEAIFSEPTDAGFWYDPGTWSGIIGSQLWTWENGADAIANAAVWKNFTDDGTTSGTPLTMAVGDSFKATIQASLSANADVGIALLSSPTSTISYSDIHNNYAVQVNIDKATNLWEVVSDGGTVDATSITGGTDLVTSFEIVFTLDTATTMTVSITSSDGGTETKSITLNNTNITGFSAYVNNNGVLNTGSQLYLIAPMEFSIFENTLGIEDLGELSDAIKIYHLNGAIHLKGLNTSDRYKMKLYDLSGRKVQEINKDNTSVNLSPGIYIANLEVVGKGTKTSKLLVTQN